MPTRPVRRSKSSLGRGVCNGELYAAHFLGPEAACKLIRMSENQPAASAASAFPAAASANKSVFYKTDGTPKSVRDVYDWALKQPSPSHALEAEANETPAAPITSASVIVGSDAGFANSRTNDWAALQLCSAAGPSSLVSMASLPQAPFAVNSDIVEMLGKLHAPSGHGHRVQ